MKSDASPEASAPTPQHNPTSETKRSFWSRFRAPMKLKFTREGKWFFGMTLAVGFAAINTGNNLLYLLLGMMLSLIIISGILCNISLNKLDIQRVLPRHIFAQTPCLISLSVVNKKRFFPSFSIELEDRLQHATQGKTCYFLKIGAQQTQKTAYRLTFPRRGLHSFVELKVSSQFPFSLFVKTRTVYLTEDVVVFPHISPVSIPSGLAQQAMGYQNSGKKGIGSDFFALRDMRPGDELRWIHWPSTARTGTFQVREFESEQQPQARLLLSQMTKSIHPSSLEHLDRAVDLAASLLYTFFHRQQTLHFSTQEKSFTLSHHTQPLEAILHHLALLEPLEECAESFRSMHPSLTFWAIVPSGFSIPQGISSQHILNAGERAA